MEANSEELELTIHSEVLLLQLNDVYHIDFRYDYSQPHTFILPRIATALKRLKNLDPDDLPDKVFFCLPGDFLAPSCLSREFKGAQMVSILNKMGLNFVTFGNHEFEKDFSEDDLIARIEESNFRWISTNIEFYNEKSFDKLYKEKLISYFDYLKLSQDTVIILLGITEDQSKYPPFITVHDPIEESQRFIELVKNELKGKNVNPKFIALSHQSLSEDETLATKCPDIILIMGGHDHNIVEEVKKAHCLVVKTASNARTLRLNWILTVPAMEIDVVTKDFKVRQDAIDLIQRDIYKRMALPKIFQMIFGKTKPAPEEKRKWAEALSTIFYEAIPGKRFSVVWTKTGEEYVIVFSFSLRTIHPLFIEMVPEDKEVMQLIEQWLNQSRESSSPIIAAPKTIWLEDQGLRTGSTNFGNFVADIVRGLPALLCDPKREEGHIGLINSGTFRLDRNIQEYEPISDRTLCEIFYHQEKIVMFHLTGEELLNLLKRANELQMKGGSEGHGDFLQLSGLEVEVEAGNIIKVHHVGLFGSKQPLNLHLKYSVATIGYVAERSEYKDFFADKEFKVVNGDLKAIVKAVLMNLKELGKADFPAFDIALNDNPRWVFK